MGRSAKAWYWEERQAFYATVHGTRHRLGTNERDAKRALKELIAAPVVRSRSVQSLVDAFIAHVKANKSDVTAGWYETRLNGFVVALGKMSTASLKAHHIQRWLDSHSGWSDTTKGGAFRAVRACFNWAVRQGHLMTSPARGVEKPQETFREVVVRPGDYETLRAHTKDEAFKELLLVAYECGPRPQELLRVEAKDVDFDLGAWVFERKNSKGKKRRRVVFLTPEALKITKRRMRRYPHGPLFRNTDGEPWTSFAVSCRFTRLKKHVGKKFCLYHFRHSFCHHALKRGVDPVTLSALMGHVDSAMISRVYSHLLHDADHMRNALMKAASPPPVGMTQDTSAGLPR